MQGEPTLYLLGETVLSPAEARFVQQHQPDYCVAPAGGARFDVGGDITMGVDELMALSRMLRGTVIANHLEAISHCQVKRAKLQAAASSAGVAQRLWVPQDGETVACEVCAQPAMVSSHNPA